VCEAMLLTWTQEVIPELLQYSSQRCSLLF
jgi:hypothetical protein